MRTLHAVCWQDATEPWGWEPCAGEEFRDLLPDGPFFWRPSDAQRNLRRLEVDDHLRSKYETGRTSVVSYSVQSYRVPDPPETW